MGLDIYFLQHEKYVTDLDDEAIEQAQKVGYFRKVNSLVSWIRTHVGPVENCIGVKLSQADLQALYNSLLQLTPANCQALFPTMEGFFFGSTAYDDYYWQDVSEVKNWLNGLLDTFDFTENLLVFYAWW